MFKSLFRIFVLLSLCINILNAQTTYISQGGGGNLSGSDISDCQPVSIGNNNGYKGTNILEGVLTNGLCIGCNNGGTISNQLSFLFDTNAAIVLPYGVCIYLGNASYVTIDGGYNGYITNTQAGTFLTKTNCSLILSSTGPRVNGIIIKNLTVGGEYIHASPTDYFVNQDASGGFYCNGAGDELQFVNDTFVDMQCCINIINCSANSLLIKGVKFINYDHGVNLTFSTKVYNVLIDSCDFGATYVWDTILDIYHHDPIHIYGSVDSLFYLTVSNNKFHDNGFNTTSFIFEESGVDSATAKHFNNLFLQSTNIIGNGMFCGGGDFYSNILVGANLENSLGMKYGGGNLYNNIISGVGTFIAYSGSKATLSNNIYTLQTKTGNDPFSIVGTNTPTFVIWQSIMNDKNSIFTNIPIVNPDGTLIPNTINTISNPNQPPISQVILTNLINILVTNITYLTNINNLILTNYISKTNTVIVSTNVILTISNPFRLTTIGKTNGIFIPLNK